MKQDKDMKIISVKQSTTTVPKDNDPTIICLILLLLVIFNAIATYTSFDNKIETIDHEYTETLNNVIKDKNKDNKKEINILAEKKYEIDKLHKKQTYYLIFYVISICAILHAIIITKQ